MNEPTPANTVSPVDFENLRKQLEDLHKGNGFLRLPRLAISVAAGVAIGLLAYWSSSNIASSVLAGIVLSIAWLALKEAELLRKHTDAILGVLDNEPATSKPERAR